jgi:hypothetical protein
MIIMDDMNLVFFWNLNLAPKYGTGRGIIPYLEYQSFCPFVRIGSPRPLSLLPLGTGGWQHSLAGEGAGGANSYDWRESLALCGPNVR